MDTFSSNENSDSRFPCMSCFNVNKYKAPFLRQLWFPTEPLLLLWPLAIPLSAFCNPSWDLLISHNNNKTLNKSKIFNIILVSLFMLWRLTQSQPIRAPKRTWPFTKSGSIMQMQVLLWTNVHTFLSFP